MKLKHILKRIKSQEYGMKLSKKVFIKIFKILMVLAFFWLMYSRAGKGSKKGEKRTMANFVLTEPEEYSDTDINFVLEDWSGDLIDAMDELRKELGYTDLVGGKAYIQLANDVYYNFYVDYNPQDGSFTVSGTANNSEHDDWKSYELNSLPMYILDEIEDAIEEAMKEMEEEE
jgi:hypothetical protein